MKPRLVPGVQWVGWGARKGCVYRAKVHECPDCGAVVLGDIDEARRWLRLHPWADDQCWEEVLAGALRADQAIWTRAFAAGERKERARLKLRSSSGAL